tara:strand:+ start:2613 stop:4163 length:1551 start_codon:yes stop_codon:yes gene_type:complete
MFNSSYFNLIFLTLFLTLTACKKVDYINGKNKNILFIIADDLNTDLSIHGHTIVKSPNLERLVKNGVIFSEAHVQYPLCGPSRASLMTGLYPSQTKMRSNRVYLRQTTPDIITIGQKLRKFGYNSIRIGKIYHYENPSSIGTSSFDDVNTWDYVINPYGIDKIEEYKINSIKKNWNGGDLSWLSSEHSDQEHTDGISVIEANKILDQHSKSKENFFLAVGLYRPHVPFVAPKKYFELYKNSEIKLPNFDKKNVYKNIPDLAIQSLRAKWDQIDRSNDSLVKIVTKAYYASNSFLDAQVGKILDKLKETGLDKNTVVIFTSDHGYHLGEKGHYMKSTLYDRSTKVPLIFSGPGIVKNYNVTEPVELIDLYPTIMDFTNNEHPSFLQGKSLKNLLIGKKEDRIGSLTELTVNNKNGYSLKTSRYRLTMWGNKGQYGFELYDHISDPEENKNIFYNENYKTIKDSVMEIMDKKIEFVFAKPKGIGRQIDGVKKIPYQSSPKPNNNNWNLDLTPKNKWIE